MFGFLRKKEKVKVFCKDCKTNTKGTDIQCYPIQYYTGVTTPLYKSVYNKLGTCEFFQPKKERTPECQTTKKS